MTIQRPTPSAPTSPPALSQTVRCSIISVGDELLIGALQDSNASWLAQQLTARGVSVLAMHICGDEQQALVAQIAAACAVSDMVLISGGLGPTDDDRTRHALATVCDVDLVHDAAAWAQVVAYFKQYHSQSVISESNKRQALTPQGAQVLTNDRGSAPGLLMTRTSAAQHTVIACMPGVPHEMYAMAERVFAQLPQLFPLAAMHQKNKEHGESHCEEIYFSGLGESRAQDMLGTLLTHGQLEIGITAQEDAYITIRLRGARANVVAQSAQIQRLLWAYLIPLAGLAPSLVAELRNRKQTVTTAESCTCGHILTQLGAVAGVSAVLEQGCVSYHARAKERLLGVDGAAIRQYGVVSEEIATAMAQGARTRAGADYALASTGIAGPDGGTEGTPVGTVWIAVASAAGTVTRRLSISGSRQRVQRRAAADALQLLWVHMHEQPQSQPQAAQ